MLEVLRTARGIARSLRIYYGDGERSAAMGQLYSRFIRPEDLVFDIGAHVGDRIAAFRRLEARVVAVEPQPALVRTLRLIYSRDSHVTIEAAAVGRQSGFVDMNLNLDNPTVATASKDFIAAASRAREWQGQTWTNSIHVPLTSLDALIEKHGVPSFIKIDVEGYEAEVLAGLSRPVRGLSFEFTTIQRDVAHACLKRCAELGYTKFNAALGESQRFEHADWIAADAVSHRIAKLPAGANSGDIYASFDEG
jgi:FkbM family methyltransferase